MCASTPYWLFFTTFFRFLVSLIFITLGFLVIDVQYILSTFHYSFLAFPDSLSYNQHFSCCSISYSLIYVRQCGEIKYASTFLASTYPSYDNLPNTPIGQGFQLPSPSSTECSKLHPGIAKSGSLPSRPSLVISHTAVFVSEGKRQLLPNCSGNCLRYLPHQYPNLKQLPWLCLESSLQLMSKNTRL